MMMMKREREASAVVTRDTFTGAPATTMMGTRPSRSIAASLLVICLMAVPQCEAFNNAVAPAAQSLSTHSHTSSAATSPLFVTSADRDMDVLSTPTSTLPPLLQDMVDERREYEINLGRAMDTLRRNYPLLLKQCPEYNIYHEDIAVVDPSGVQLNGLSNYQSSFRFLRSLIGLFYNIDKSSIQHKMVYDFARQSIRISFNVMLVPKVVGNRRNSLYIDGISIYQMHSKSGTIVEHKVEKLLMNNIPVRPPYGMLTELLSPVPSLQRQGGALGVPAGGFGFSNAGGL